MTRIDRILTDQLTQRAVDMMKIHSVSLVAGCLIAAAVFGLHSVVRAAEEPPSVDAVVDAYTSAWNEPDVDARRALLEKGWADDGRYSDPSADVTGRDALIEHISGFLSNPSMKGFSLSRTSAVDSHHHVLRFGWVLKNAEGAVVMEGIDFGVLDDDGRLQSITGFFGPMPELE
jgi:hypothetical protein